MGKHRVNGFIAALVLATTGVLAATVLRGGGFASEMVPWLAFVALFAIVELADMSFHDEEARFGLSFSEALFIPIVVGFTFAQAVWGVVLAIAIVQTVRYQSGLQKWFFNVGSFGCASAGAAAVWWALAAGPETLTVRNGAVAVLAGIVFAFLTHIFTSVVLAFATGRSLDELTRGVAPATLLGWAGTASFGLLFAGSYLAAPWTVAIFPIPLLGLYLGYRAILRQRGERDRIEKLHEATRALVASPDLDHAVVGFLHAVEEIVSASEARAVLRGRRRLVWCGVRGGAPTCVMEPIAGTSNEDLLQEVSRAGGTLILREGEEGPRRWLLESLGARNLIAVALQDEGGGCLVAIDRTGADEFSADEARLLEALSQELVLSLDSYRLFAQVAEERERFRRIFAGSREGICLLDDTGVVIAWNPALEEITGYRAEEVAGKAFAQHVLVRDSDERRLGLDDILELEPDRVLELVTRDGPARWVAILAGSVAHGIDQGHVVLVRDVTSEHILEEAKSDFLSTISHELRTPLTAIKGSLQILARGQNAVPDNVYDQMIGVLGRGSDRLERLVLNLLFVSQVELDGTPRVFAEALDLEDIVRDRMEPLVQDHPSAEVVTESEPIVVRADRERLGQVVEHLVDNAVKFGGAAPIRVELRRDAGYAEIAVTDAGPGIAPADHERIFDRFVRLGETLVRKTQGAGVGLFIVKESVKAMGGSVHVESELGRGATFIARLPLARPMAVDVTA